MSTLGKTPFSTGIRRMFYAVSLNETSFKDADDVPQYINEANPFFFVFIFLELGISLLKKDGKYKMNDSFTSFSAGMFSRLPMLLFNSVTFEAYIWVYQNYCIKELPWDSAWTWWLAFLGVDLGYYWFHRMAHEVNFMWAAHQVHHSSEYYNLSTALRQSVLQGQTSWAFYLPMAFFVPPSIFIAHHELNILYQFWIHTQYIKSLGPLEYILNTPSHHRVHHGRNPYCIDKNYAGTLIIWDRIFGTFAKEEEEVAYGLVYNINTFEPVAVQFSYPQYVFGRFAAISTLWNKIKVLLCGPGWSPGKPRMGEHADIPQVEKPVKVYNVALPSWLSVYVFVHFTLVMVWHQEVLARKAGLSQTSILVFVILSLLNLTSTGQLCDKNPSARIFELLRCISYILGEIIACQYGLYGSPGQRPAFMYAFQAFYAFSASIWIIDMFREKSVLGNRGKMTETSKTD